MDYNIKKAVLEAQVRAADEFRFINGISDDVDLHAVNTTKIEYGLTGMIAKITVCVQGIDDGEIFNITVMDFTYEVWLERL